MTADDPILAWRTSNRINLTLIAELPEAALRVTRYAIWEWDRI